MTPQQLYEAFAKLDIEKIALDSMAETSAQLLAKNKEQMLEGKNRLGNDITPSYFNDPFFKSPEAAKRYSDWKDEITPNPKRKSGTPNLFINGKFHSSLSIKLDGEKVSFDGTFKFSAITGKFSENIMGLGGEKKLEYLEEDLQPAWKAKIEKATGLKMK